MLSVTIKVSWAMAHRLAAGYLGKCSAIHGHEYVAEIIFFPATHPTMGELDEKGMVEDFSQLKYLVKKAFLDKYDHSLVLNEEDRETLKLHEVLKNVQEVYYINGNPTAEVFVQYIYAELKQKMCEWKTKGVMREDLEITTIRLYETPNAWCEFIPNF